MLSRASKYSSTLALSAVVALTGSARLAPAFARLWDHKPTTTAPYPRECPTEDSLKAVKDMIGETAGMPEFNDCQAFIVGKETSLRFDSLYAIYAFHLQTLQLSTTGGLATLVAVIQSFGGTYDSLGIVPGFNCLYLYPSQQPASSRYSARMMPKGSVDKCPERLAVTALTGKVLEVRARSSAGETDSLYPPVARWDWDRKNSEQYIGIKCENAWCEIGRQRFFASRPWIPSAGIPKKHNLLVKGWYDEQILATTSAPSGSAEVSGIRGTIFPAPRLATLTQTDFTGQWRTTAYIALSGKISKYEKMLNLAPTPGAAPEFAADFKSMDSIQYCRAATGSPCADVPSGAAAPSCGIYAGLSWGWARISRAGTYHYFCVPRWDHTAGTNPVPATTRWRWLAQDETTWTKCDQGCCEVRP